MREFKSAGGYRRRLYPLIRRSFGTFARQICAALHLSFSLALFFFCSFYLSFFLFLRRFGWLFRFFDAVICRLPALRRRAAEPRRTCATSPPTATANTTASSWQPHPCFLSPLSPLSLTTTKRWLKLPAVSQPLNLPKSRAAFEAGTCQSDRCYSGSFGQQRTMLTIKFNQTSSRPARASPPVFCVRKIQKCRGSLGIRAVSDQRRRCAFPVI